MSEFFRGWKRKVGVLTLLMACICMCLLIRGETHSDTLYIPCGARTRVAINSVHGYLLFESETYAWDSTSYWPYWNSLFCCDRNLLYLFYLDNSIGWRFQCFAIGTHTVEAQNRGSGTQLFLERRTLFVSCWSIVLPLTLISAWLLLSKPTSKTVTDLNTSEDR